MASLREPLPSTWLLKTEVLCSAHREMLSCFSKPDFLVEPIYRDIIILLRVALVAQRLKRLPAMWESWVQSLGWEDPLEKEMAIHSCFLAWRIPWTEEPGGLQSTRSQRVGHDWATSLSLSRGIRVPISQGSEESWVNKGEIWNSDSDLALPLTGFALRWQLLSRFHQPYQLCSTSSHTFPSVLSPLTNLF